MNCFRCKAPLTNSNYCMGCKVDVRVYKRIIMRSNAWYNLGLSAAREKNLTEARKSLKMSIFYNKENIEARNLLGLVYYQTGMVVEALNEWNISIHLSRNMNPAARYLNEFSIDPAMLENVRQSVSKYNTAVDYAKHNSEDLAIIQLNKALSMNNHMFLAYKLLGLIFIKQKEYIKARKALRRAYQIDHGDTDVVAYIREAKHQYAITVAERKNQPLHVRLRYALAYRHSRSIGDVEESGIKKVLPAFLYLFIGFIVGLGFALLLILPQQRLNVENEYRQKEQSIFMNSNIPTPTPVPTPAPTPEPTPVPEGMPTDGMVPSDGVTPDGGVVPASTDTPVPNAVG